MAEHRKLNKLDILCKKYGGKVVAFHRGLYSYSDDMSESLIMAIIKEKELRQALMEDGTIEWKSHIGGDSTENGYTTEYIKLFDKIKDNNINFLEIGVFQGRSLAMWSDYFKNGNVCGIDLRIDEFFYMTDELKKMGAFSNKNLGWVIEMDSTIEKFTKLDSEIRTLSYSSDQEIDDFVKNKKYFNIIIDDGDHHYENQLKTFDNFYPVLSFDGIYVIEDVHIDLNSKLIKDIWGLNDKYNDIDSVELIECKGNTRIIVIKKRSDNGSRNKTKSM